MVTTISQICEAIQSASVSKFYLQIFSLIYLQLPNGVSKLEMDKAFLARNHGFDDLFDEFVVRQVCDDDNASGFFEGIEKFLVSTFSFYDDST